MGVNPVSPVSTISATRRTATSRPPTHDEIAARAYAMWEDQGRPEGHDSDIWLAAERALRDEAAGYREVDQLPADAEDLDALEITPPLERRIDEVVGSPVGQPPSSRTSL